MSRLNLWLLAAILLAACGGPAAPRLAQPPTAIPIVKSPLPTWTPPVVANGRLYLREQDNLYSYDIQR